MSRTDTTAFTTFNLPSPDQATFAFSSNFASITITVPQGSRWRMPIHWHVHDTLGCVSVGCLTGNIRVYKSNERTNGDFFRGPGRSVVFKPGEAVTFCSSRTSRDPRHSRKYICTEDWSVELLVTDQNLYRNTCSAILDRDIYPQLSSTPFWLKLLFHLLRLLPRVREALLSLLLWVQLQTILYAHDFHLYHGSINLSWPWVHQIGGGNRPPQWVLTLQLRIRYLISRVVMGSCYWFGRLMLGMKGEYREYTPPPSHARGDIKMELDEKNTATDLV